MDVFRLLEWGVFSCMNSSDSAVSLGRNDQSKSNSDDIVVTDVFDSIKNDVFSLDTS